MVRLLHWCAAVFSGLFTMAFFLVLVDLVAISFPYINPYRDEAIVSVLILCGLAAYITYRSFQLLRRDSESIRRSRDK